MPRLQRPERAGSGGACTLGARRQAALATTRRRCLSPDAIAAHDWACQTNGANRCCGTRGERLRRRKVHFATYVDDNSDHDFVYDVCRKLCQFRNRLAVVRLHRRTPEQRGLLRRG